jgi:UDP-glucose 4-epimerase
MDTVSLRFFNAYGPRQPASSPYAGAIAKFCEAAAAGRDLTVHGSGRQSRDMIFVGDVAEAVALAAERDGRLGGVAINVGSGRSVSILVLAGKTRKLASPPAKVGFAERRPGDPEKTLADVGRARELLGFWARTPLTNGLRKTWDWYSGRPQCPGKT